MEKILSDENLVKDYKRGNETNFEILVKRYLPLVYGLARRYTGDSDKASDIAQETFLKTWRNIKKFDTNRSFKPWILAITKNTALDWLKAKKALPFSHFTGQEGDLNIIENIVDPVPLPIIIAEKNIALEQAEKLIATLPQDYSSVVYLRDRDDLTFNEIAKILKKPLNTVKSQYHRALKILRGHAAS